MISIIVIIIIIVISIIIIIIIISSSMCITTSTTPRIRASSRGLMVILDTGERHNKPRLWSSFFYPSSK